MEQLKFYFHLGLNHVLDFQAYDHILFLTVLTIPYLFKDWKRILILVSVFTLGHTLTLLLSVYGVLTIKGSYIEFLIPLTILVTALYNIFTAGKPTQKNGYGLILFITLFFGLIHGLGFSNYFKHIISGESDKLLPLLEFALGIEAAQIIIVLIILIMGYAIQFLFRFSTKEWILCGSSVVLGMTIPMVINNYPF